VLSCDASPEWREDFGAGRANSVKARASDSGDLRSAVTEFVPALRCHYPGQAGIFKVRARDDDGPGCLNVVLTGRALQQANRAHN
jgi:hypothetical protein